MNPFILADITFDLSAISGYAIIVSVVGYLTVFFALVVLYYVYSTIPKLINFELRRKLKRAGKDKETEPTLNISGEVNAAISTALYLYLNEHDEESTTLTIKNIQRSYTPWSSRIYSVNDYYKMR
jgi:Na+-transporting methylmalonyl-CoA/oxaloacetate decarboxylase gamma subunit